MITTLRNWQTIKKNKKDLIFCSSEYRFCNDLWTGFTVGIGPKIIDYINSGKNFYDIQFGSHSKTVLCKISTWTDKGRRLNSDKNREKIVETLSKANIINSPGRSDIREYMLLDDIHNYFDELAKHKFIISPEGNSKDSHRNYEAVLAGSVPIMEYSDEMEYIYEGLPILWTYNYSEINEEYLLNKYKEMIDEEFDFSKMFLYNYSSEQQKQIIQNANYWVGDGRWGERWYD
jgi:hypothetical protein